ncbi:MAG: hypothetical protein EBX40_03560 [Gammaproteobacteria bacterium]|nr:hypothetical protein [Gammaproteobacteria bacterium]
MSSSSSYSRLSVSSDHFSQNKAPVIPGSILSDLIETSDNAAAAAKALSRLAQSQSPHERPTVGDGPQMGVLAPGDTAKASTEIKNELTRRFRACALQLNRYKRGKTSSVVTATTVQYLANKDVRGKIISKLLNELDYAAAVELFKKKLIGHAAGTNLVLEKKGEPDRLPMTMAELDREFEAAKVCVRKSKAKSNQESEVVRLPMENCEEHSEKSASLSSKAVPLQAALPVLQPSLTGSSVAAQPAKRPHQDSDESETMSQQKRSRVQDAGLREKLSKEYAGYLKLLFSQNREKFNQKIAAIREKLSSQYESIEPHQLDNFLIGLGSFNAQTELKESPFWTAHCLFQMDRTYLIWFHTKKLPGIFTLAAQIWQLIKPMPAASNPSTAPAPSGANAHLLYSAGQRAQQTGEVIATASL